MFENIITFIQAQLQNILDLINSLSTSGSSISRTLIRQLIALFQSSVENIIALLGSVLLTVSPAVQREIVAVIRVLRSSLRPITTTLFVLLATTNQTVEEITNALGQFFSSFFGDLEAVIDSIFNPPSPQF